MQYLFSRCTEFGDGYIIEPEDVRRWKKLIAIPYANLTGESKDSGRKEADRTIAILEELDDALLGDLCGDSVMSV